ncbi:MAG: peptidylprolyl isomerase [Dehalococcoidia bacterium]
MSRAAVRRRQEELQARRDRRVLLGTAGVLGATVIIILVGLYMTVYRPPREQVATISTHAVTAEDVADRATFYMVSEGGAFSRESQDTPTLGLDRLVRDAVILRQAPALVGEVTDADADARAREVLGGLEGDAYGKALQDVLQRAGISQQQYRDILKSRLLADRLTERFKGEVPATLDERHLLRARTPSKVNADRVIERAKAGEDFTKLAQQYGADRSLEVDQDWMPDELLTPETRDALAGLQAGDVSAPIPSGLFFDVFFVAGVENGRAVSDEQKGKLASRRLDTWVTEQEPNMMVMRNVSSGASTWITKQVTARVRKAFANVPSSVPSSGQTVPLQQTIPVPSQGTP